MADIKLQKHIRDNFQKKRNEERRIQALKEQGRQQKQSAKADKEWKVLEEAANNVIEHGYKGYDNWISAYSEIIGLCSKLNKAIYASNPTSQMANMLFDKIFKPRLHQLEDHFGNKMPKFKVQGVDYTNDNKLDINGLNVTAADGTILPPGTDEIFQKGVVSWLNSRGYTPTNNTSSEFKDRHNNPLTQDDFYQLLEDKDQGLGAYLGKHYDVKVDYQPTPRPGP